MIHKIKGKMGTVLMQLSEFRDLRAGAAAERGS
jgi:hypothetical protein